MIHLTFTGSLAGQPICGALRKSGGEHAHAVYAPLHIAEYRNRVCPDCLRVYAESYIDPVEYTDPATLPDWVRELLETEE